MRVVVEVSADDGASWEERLDTVLDPVAPATLVAPAPTGAVRWRARDLYPVRRHAESEIFARQEGDLDLVAGAEATVALRFERGGVAAAGGGH